MIELILAARHGQVGRKIEMIGMSHDGKDNYFCRCCGMAWKAGKRYQWWPIRIKWSNKWNIGTHGYEVGHLMVEQRVFVRVVHLGFFRVLLGRDDFKSPIVKNHTHAGWLPRKRAIDA